MMLHRAPISRWLGTALRISERPAHVELPVFLCPSVRYAVASTPRARRLPWRTHQQQQQRRRIHAQASAAATVSPVEDDAPPAAAAPAAAAPAAAEEKFPIEKLPKQCTGCGALSQLSFPDQPGYYDVTRKGVRKFVGIEEDHRSRRSTREEDRIAEEALRNLSEKGLDLEALGLSFPPVDDPMPSPKPQKPPLCDRCHYLLHNHSGKSIFHPTIDSIKDTLMESPYKYNHVYHILDAADFPMSILPGIHSLLDLMPLRTKNRRSRLSRYYHGQRTELSFIITRSDLLAPTKPQVDRLVPYLQEVLREVLGRSGRNVRLGNIRCVSARRSWWTKELREDIWKRGGAGWMVGKVNVGKSQLFEAVFPKGRMEWKPSDHQISVDLYNNRLDARAEDQKTLEDFDLSNEDTLDEYSLLPPAPAETQYPEMPLVSDLPGTTASPIRVPFGGGRGELIDMPGLERTGLEKFVKEEHRLSLTMKSRIVPEQMVLKPGQSLLLGGGLIRITPREPAPVVLSYAFTPIEAHLTATPKAIALQAQTSEVQVESIAVPGTGEKTQLAGSFELKWDVTKARTGPLTRKHDVGLSVDRLPYRVLSADILIEGVGWVEVTAQVRTKHLFTPKEGATNEAETTSDAATTTTEPPPPKETEPPPEKELSALERLEALAEDPNKKKKQQQQQIPTHKPKPKQKEKDVEWDAPEEDQGVGEGEGEEAQGDLNWPVVDVYSPEGKFVGYRPPMNGWLLNKPRVTKAQKRKRPRRSMKGAKKLAKKRAREAAGVGAGARAGPGAGAGTASF